MISLERERKCNKHHPTFFELNSKPEVPPLVKRIALKLEMLDSMLNVLRKKEKDWLQFFWKRKDILPKYLFYSATFLCIWILKYDD